MNKTYLDDVPIITRKEAERGASRILQGLFPGTTEAHKALAREYLDRTYDKKLLPSVYTQELMHFLWKTGWKV